MHEVARASHPRTPLPRKGNPLWLPCRWPTPVRVTPCGCPAVGLPPQSNWRPRAKRATIGRLWLNPIATPSRSVGERCHDAN